MLLDVHGTAALLESSNMKQMSLRGHLFPAKDERFTEAKVKVTHKHKRNSQSNDKALTRRWKKKTELQSKKEDTNNFIVC